MTKKPRTAKQLANDERLRKLAKERREAKKQNDQAEQRIESTPTNEPDIGELQQQIEELRKALINQQANKSGATVSDKGTIGTHVKYVVDSGYYADPVPRLFEFMESKPQLRRLGFKDNWELNYSVKPTKSYERIDGVREIQPQFTLELVRIIYDEKTFEPTNKRYTPRRMVFFEDPETAIIVARENGIDVDEDNERAFLDEMRFLRMRDWLEEAFYPKPAQTPASMREEVIGNQRVEVYEISSEDTATIPFDQMSTKLKG